MTYFNRNSESKHALILCPKHYTHSMGEVILSNENGIQSKSRLAVESELLGPGLS